MNLKLSWRTLDKIHENNSLMTVVLGDFNAKSNNWCKVDSTSLESSMIDTIASSYGLNHGVKILNWSNNS